jgi:hypothetical protein
MHALMALPVPQPQAEVFIFVSISNGIFTPTRDKLKLPFDTKVLYRNCEVQAKPDVVT